MEAIIQEKDGSTETVEQRFDRLAQEWNRATGHLSSMSAAAKHPAHQAIVAMGRDVLPCLLQDLERNHTPWFRALKAITGARPVSASMAGKVPAMVEAWLDWAKKQGIKW